MCGAPASQLPTSDDAQTRSAQQQRPFRQLEGSGCCACLFIRTGATSRPGVRRPGAGAAAAGRQRRDLTPSIGCSTSFRATLHFTPARRQGCVGSVSTRAAARRIPACMRPRFGPAVVPPPTRVWGIEASSASLIVHTNSNRLPHNQRPSRSFSNEVLGFGRFGGPRPHSSFLSGHVARGGRGM